MLQLREKEIFKTLNILQHKDFVLIGGYAVNAYTLPRFSVDCDIVVNDNNELNLIEKMLKEKGYFETHSSVEVPYSGTFKRFEKSIENNYKISIDILFDKVLDRQTNASFSTEWVFQNSDIRVLRAKTFQEEIRLKIINSDALFVMKMISCRSTDIRDLFMLAPYIDNKDWIKQEISNRFDFINRFSKFVTKIKSKQFKDGLQGVFGYIDMKLFEKHLKIILDLKN